MLTAGITEIEGRVSLLELADPDALAADEVLIEVKAAGVGNWDEIVRTGGWDVGTRPPMALGVEAAGIIMATGPSVSGLSVGDSVLTHPVPLRHQGAWAQRLVALAATVAKKPPTVSWEAAGAFPVPALTAEQVLAEALSLSSGTSLLVHGAGGVTGGLIVQLGTLRGADVIATAGPASHKRVRRLGARTVLDRTDPNWPDQVGVLLHGKHPTAAVNLVRGEAARALAVVADGGRLVTITSDPPPEVRGITVVDFYVRPDGRQLAALVHLLAEEKLSLPVAATVRLEDAEHALRQVSASSAQGAVVVRP